MSNQLSTLDLMRIRYMKGEPLLQAGDSFDFVEVLEAMETVNQEVRGKDLPSPVAIRQAWEVSEAAVGESNLRAMLRSLRRPD
jgi:hypothetical protein